MRRAAVCPEPARERARGPGFGALVPVRDTRECAESYREVMVMFTIRNMGGVALFLAGSTWLWLTPAFAPKGEDTSGLAW